MKTITNINTNIAGYEGGAYEGIQREVGVLLVC